MKNDRGEINSESKKIISLIKDYSYSIQYISLAFGVLATILGLIIIIFLRGIQFSGFLVLSIGILAFILSLIINISSIKRAIFSSKGAYGANTIFILIATIFILIATNSVIYILNDRGSSPSWFRSDLTASKEYQLSSQAINAIENIKEDLEIFIFLRSDSSQDKLSINRTEDLLSEFSKNSNKYNLTYKHVDPDLDPNLASSLNVDRYLAGRDLPVLILKLKESQRISYVVGKDPNESIDVFSEKDLISALLVVNQIKQKLVLFLSGHEERDITNIDKASESFGQAKISLERDNYIVNSVTSDELSRLLLSGNREAFPAALIIADASDEILSSEQNLIQEYVRLGGNLMLLLEPDSPSGLSKLVSPWGVVSGNGTLVDTASYVAPNIEFLQIKDSNLQIPEHPITHNFDVMYFPGSKFIGLSLKPDEITLTENGRPYINAEPIAYTTLNSWEETSNESINFDGEYELAGPLPIILAVESIAAINESPVKNERGDYVTSKLIISGDTDFASNKFLFSAKNEDLFANSVNWLTSDVELISIRPKIKVFRELVLTQDERNFVRWSGWIFLPGISIFLALWSWWRRR
jgi:hypothetical protein